MANKAILVGNLGSDPDVKHTTEGTAVATLSLATNRSYKDKNEKWQTETEWHRLVAWAGKAEYCEKHLSKGSKIYVTGRLKTRKWQDEQDGIDRYVTEIIIEEIEILTPKSGGNGSEPPPHDDGDNHR